MKHMIIALSLLSSPMIAKEQTLSPSELENIYNKLNISTFRSSLMPMRTKEKTYLKQMGLPSPTYFKNGFSIESNDWSYTFTVKEKKDKNRDGVMDYTICLSDKSKTGTYNSISPILISPLWVDNQLIALSFTVDGC